MTAEMAATPEQPKRSSALTSPAGGTGLDGHPGTRVTAKPHEIGYI